MTNSSIYTLFIVIPWMIILVPHWHRAEQPLFIKLTAGVHFAFLILFFHQAVPERGWLYATASSACLVAFVTAGGYVLHRYTAWWNSRT